MNRLFFIVLVLLGVTLMACEKTAVPAEAAIPPKRVDDLPVYKDLKPLKVSANDLSSQGAPGYTITLQHVGKPSEEVKDALQKAAKRWENVFTHGLPDFEGDIAANTCGSSQNPDFSGTVDDVLIFAGVIEIDGEGGVLAKAGPCLIRTSSGLTIVGSLVFDTADLARFTGQLTDIAAHEMGHILGIGNLWSRSELIADAGTDNPTFLGAEANEEYRKLGGKGNIPLANEGSTASRDRHWRESVFQTELMTGSRNKGEAANALSRLTIASLSDLGYYVDLDAADPYTLPTGNASGDSSSLQTLSTEDGLEFKEELLEPVARVE
ncbi:MAG: leishmanolysin-related zinc metalloendopeptidase [Trueperaceae bacterium]